MRQAEPARGAGVHDEARPASTVWNGMPPGRSPRMTRAASAADWRPAVVVVAPERRRSAPPSAWLVWNAKIGRRARVGRLLQRREGRGRQVAGDLADHVGPPRRERQRGVGARPLLVLAGTSIELEAPPCVTACQQVAC